MEAILRDFEAEKLADVITLPENKPHKNRECRISKQYPPREPILAFPKGEINQWICNDDWIYEPRKIGESVTECRADNHNPKSIAYTIGNTQSIEPFISNPNMNANIPNHEYRKCAIQQKIPTEPHSRKF